MRAGLRTVALVLAGCGRWGFDEARTGADAPVEAEADAELPDVCDSSAAFGVPVTIPELSDPAVNDGTLRLAPDELSGYFWSNRTTAGAFSRIFFVTRPDFMTPFTLQPVTGLNTTGNDLDPTMPTMGAKILVFRHNMPGDDLWIATAATDVDFTGATPIANLNSTATDSQPFVRPGSNGLSLYFRSDAVVPSLGMHNIYVSTRPTTSSLWGTPALVPNVNSALDDGPSSLSSDGCRLYISSDRNGTNDVFVATRGA